MEKDVFKNNSFVGVTAYGRKPLQNIWGTDPLFVTVILA